MIREVRWTAWSEEHIARHNVLPHEVEDVLFTRPQLVVKTRGGALAVFGTSGAGRHLAVMISLDDDGASAFVITARDMTKNERQVFQKKGR